MLPPDELDAGKRARALTMCVRCVCRCIAGSRHRDLFQAPPREANGALVYATKQAQLESGLGLCIACSALQRHRTVNVRCTLHRRWGRTTPSRGTLTTAPSTRCAGDKPPQCIHPTRIKDAHEPLMHFRLPTYLGPAPILTMCCRPLTRAHP